jgi:hypothetical protein
MAGNAKGKCEVLPDGMIFMPSLIKNRHFVKKLLEGAGTRS